MSLITLGLATDYLTEAGSDPTAPITISNRPFFWQQMERTRANFADTLDNLANIKHAQVTLTNGDLIALPGTPITIVSAPSSGHRIKVISASIRVNKTTAYSGLNATYCAIALYWLGDFSQWAANGIVNDSGATLTQLSTLITGTGIHIADMGTYTDNYGNGWNIPNVYPSTVAEAKALAIAADNNGSGNFGGGNALNSARVDVFYTDLS